MTTTKVAEMSVTVNNSPFQDYTEAKITLIFNLLRWPSGDYINNFWLPDNKK